MIRCSAGKCVHNHAWRCTATKVNISTDAFCASYLTERISAAKELVYEFARELNPIAEIACNADECVYNHGFICRADEISVLAPISYSDALCVCSTYKKWID